MMSPRVQMIGGYAVPLVFYLGLALVSLRMFFYSQDPVAFHDLAPITSFEQLSRPLAFPWDSMSNLGAPNVVPFNAIYNMVLYVFSYATGSVILGHKVMLVFLQAMIGFGSYLAFKRPLGGDRGGAFVAGLFMSYNGFVFKRWVSGHNTIILAMVFFPLALALYFDITRNASRLKILCLGLLLSAMTAASPHISYLFLLFVVLHSLTEIVVMRRIGLKRLLVRRIAVLFPAGLISIIPLVPWVNVLTHTAQPNISIRPEEIIFDIPSATNLGLLALILTLVFSVFLVAELRSNKTFFYLMAIVFSALALPSLMLAAGFEETVRGAYLWMFKNVPGMSFFRETQRFVLLPIICASYIFGSLVVALERLLRGAKIRTSISHLVAVGSLSLFVVSASPQFFGGEMSDLVGTSSIPSDYVQLNRWLSDQKDDFRVALIPPAVWATKYDWAKTWFLDPLVALQAKPTVELKSEQSLMASDSFTRWTYTALYNGNSVDRGSILSLLGVKYLIARSDADMPTFRPDLAAFNRTNTDRVLKEVRSLPVERQFGSLTVYRVPHPLPTIFQTGGYSLLAGDRSLLVSLGGVGFDFSQAPPVFIQDVSDIAKAYAQANVVVFEGDPYWTLLSRTKGAVNIRVENHAQLSAYPSEGWVRGSLMWHIHRGELNSSPSGFIYTVGQNTLTLPFEAATGEYLLLVRYFDGLPGAEGFTVKHSNQAFAVFPDPSSPGGYVWRVLGKVGHNGGRGLLSLTNFAGPAAVSEITLIPVSLQANGLREVSGVLQASSKEILYFFNRGSWRMYANMTSTFDREKDGGIGVSAEQGIATSFYILASGNYSLTLKAVPLRSPSVTTVFIDGVPMNLTADSKGVSRLLLKEGVHTMEIRGPIVVETAILKMGGAGGSVVEVPPYINEQGARYVVSPAPGKYVVFLQESAGWRLVGSSGPITPLRMANFASIVPPSSGGPIEFRYEGLDYFQQGILISIVLMPVGLILVVLTSRLVHRVGK